jgi:hypothetical protein
MTTYAPSRTSKRVGNKRAPILNLCMTPHHNVAKPYHFTLPIEGKSTQKGTNIGGDKARQGSRNFTQICAGIRASERGEILRVGVGLSIEQIKGAAARKAQRSCASDFNCA